ncbi:MAG: primosomal protein N', partial [Gammaproteobacteria bacterium]
MTSTVLRVALPVPLPGLFDYLPPGGKTVAGCRPGQRVLVPFGKGERIGLIVAIDAQPEVAVERLRPVERVLDTEPLLDADHLDFLRWTAGYYHHWPGEVVCSALPLRLRKRPDMLPVAVPGVALAVQPAEALAQISKRAPRQRELIEALAATPEGRMSRDSLTAGSTGASATLRRLLEQGCVRLCDMPATPALYRPRPPGYGLNEEQTAAIAAVSAALGEFASFLLQGVTGSGKTEVYLQLVERVLARGESAMVLVPEISLTPQLRQRFVERLGGEVALLHSALNDSERERTWQRVRLGLVRVVLGTRSTVLYPVDRLGLVIVDEEHDPSFKQQEGFRYSARDLAVVRARRAGCPVVLGSATPSFESLHNVATGRYRLLRLNRRAGGASPPDIRLLDVRDQPLRSGISDPLMKALRDTLAAGEQAMVFLNRRGFAPVLACYDCGWVSDCPRCDA